MNVVFIIPFSQNIIICKLIAEIVSTVFGIINEHNDQSTTCNELELFLKEMNCTEGSGNTIHFQPSRGQIH